MRFFLKLLLFVPLLTFFQTSNAQIPVHSIVVEATGFYQNGVDISYPFTPAPPLADSYFSPGNDRQKTSKLTGSVGFMLNKHLLISIGLTHMKGSINNSIHHTESDNIKQLEVIGRRRFTYSNNRPFFEVKYLYNLNKRFWLAPALHVGWGSQQYRYREYIQQTETYPNEPNAYPSLLTTTTSTNYSSETILVSISPVIGYNFTKWLGIKLNVGGWSLLKDNTGSARYLTTQEFITFNPNRWSVGLYSAFDVSK
ncbi:hypothetical protein [Telluribacter sp.]|jgi:hypothetical protein|uniref:hypothetical protein n=1 Tax=Telluribacter sp. TaxID=1978767 RepID=UPI002E114812|nr:hypothetical protein [Telluribacter sp.]